MQNGQAPLWVGPLIVVAGIASIILRNWQQAVSARWTRRLLGERRAERYYGRMMHAGWSLASVLAGVFFIVLGIAVTAAAIAR